MRDVYTRGAPRRRIKRGRIEMPHGQASGRDWAAIMDKLERVKRLQERAGTPAEAEAAAAALIKLLTKHNLTAAEFDHRAERSPQDDYVQRLFDLGGRTSWQRDLLDHIAQNNFCRAVHVLGRDKSYLVGEPRNIQVVRDLYTYLRREVDRLADRAWEEARSSSPAWISPREWKRSYRTGVVDGIGTVMAEAKRAAAAEVEHGSQIVLVKDAELTAARDRLIGPVEPMRPTSRRFFDGGARERGWHDGKQLDLEHKRPLAS